VSRRPLQHGKWYAGNNNAVRQIVGRWPRGDRSSDGCPGGGQHERTQPVGVHQKETDQHFEWYDQKSVVAVQSGRPDERQRQTRMDH